VRGVEEVGVEGLGFWVDGVEWRRWGCVVSFLRSGNVSILL
jgi:hypothetical protein